MIVVIHSKTKPNNTHSDLTCLSELDGIFGYVTGTWRGFLGASFVLTDWKVRVFWLYGLVDRLSDRLYVRTITLYGCIYRCSHYAHFYSQAWLTRHRKTCTLYASPEELSPYGSPHWGPPGTWTFSDDWTAWGIPHNETVSYKNWEAYNLGVHSTLVTRFNFTQLIQNRGQVGFLNSPGDFCWSDLTRWSYRWHLGLNSFA